VESLDDDPAGPERFTQRIVTSGCSRGNTCQFSIWIWQALLAWKTLPDFLSIHSQTNIQRET
jgi:hypothetical protein